MVAAVSASQQLTYGLKAFVLAKLGPVSFTIFLRKATSDNSEKKAMHSTAIAWPIELAKPTVVPIRGQQSACLKRHVFVHIRLHRCIE